MFQSAEDLAEIVRSLLREPERALAITLAGHRRVLREHTFYHRACRLLDDALGPAVRPASPPDLAASP